jgi:hypothetical protein
MEYMCVGMCIYVFICIYLLSDMFNVMKDAKRMLIHLIFQFSIREETEQLICHQNK